MGKWGKMNYSNCFCVSLLFKDFSIFYQEKKTNKQTIIKVIVVMETTFQNEVVYKNNFSTK